MTNKIIKNTLGALAFMVLAASGSAASAGVASITLGNVSSIDAKFNEAETAPIKVNSRRRGYGHRGYGGHRRYYGGRNYYGGHRRGYRGHRNYYGGHRRGYYGGRGHYRRGGGYYGHREYQGG